VSVGVELIVAWFIHRKGVNLTGDEPAYIIQAQAYLHLSPNIFSTIRADLSVHSLAAYAPGAPVSAVASFAGPRGVISPFEPGLGLLLIPFVATGRLFLGSTVGMLVLNTAGLIYIHRRVSRLTTLDRRCQFLLGLMLAAPAVLLAVTQIYPDLLSGILLACAIVEIAFIERTGVSARLGTAVIGFSLAFLPWLQGKNLAPAVVALVALLIVRLRVSAGRRTTFVILTLCLLSWGLLLAYNLRYFGHLTGLPEPAPNFGHNGVEYTLGLLFDRDQGLFVQVPVAVVGFLGLWMARKRLPISVIATVVSVGSVLLLNGTYTSNPYGGRSLAGRFMWTAIPLLVAWTGPVLARWQRAGRPMRWPIALVGGLWIYQAVPILDGSHTYYNFFTQTPPWEPASWPGWWPGFNRLLPQFDLPGHFLGSPSEALAIVLAIAAILAVAASQYARADRFSNRSAATVGALGVLVLASLVVVRPLGPLTSVSFDSAQLGTPIVGHGHPSTSHVVDLEGVPRGTYALELSYGLGGPASGVMIVTFASLEAPARSVRVFLPSGQETRTASIQCQGSGVITAQFQVGAGSRLVVYTLRLESVSAGGDVA
jgi:hypothetical protein